MNLFEVGEQEVFVIAEVAQAHDGSLGFAHAYIDAVADAKADAVKFQTHIADEESTRAEPWRIPFSYEDKLRYDYWKRMEFTEEQWAGLKAHTEERGLIFMSSPFSVKAAEMLERIGIEIWKISSGEIYNPWLIEFVLQTKKPIIFSTGMSSMKQVTNLADEMSLQNAKYGLLQCTTSYPVSPDKVGLNVLADYIRLFRNIPIGLSDHSGEIWPSLAAVSLGARIIEAHVCLSKYDFGPDVSSSLTQGQFKHMVEGIRFTQQMLDNPVDKDRLSGELQSMSQIFSKSVCARIELPSGTLLTREMVALKKPANGVTAAEVENLIGKKTKRNFLVDEFIKYEDVE